MGNVIACLGWGSLIWDPRELPIQRSWFEYGPLVRVEFVRRSKCRIDNHNDCKCGPLTLVLYDKAAKPVRSLWAPMTVDTHPAAVRALAVREYPDIAKTPEGKITSWSKENIGQWSRGAPDPEAIPGLGTWATGLDIDIEHVIWTALGPKFDGDPNEDRVIEYLSNLSGDHRKRAEKYVCCAPPQTKTAYRRRIEAALSWSPCGGESDSS